MTRPEDAASLAEYVDATARLLELPIRPEHRDGVLQQFARLAALARLVTAHPLGYHDEPLPLIDPGKLE